MAVFLTSDLHLNDKEKARQLGLTASEYNQMIINHWNEIISKDDKVLVMGEIGHRDLHIIKNVVSQLNGKKYLIDYDSNNYKPRSLWKWVGFDQIWTIEMHYDTYINNAAAILWIRNNEKDMEDNAYGCVGEKVLGNELYKDKRLNISLSQWDYYPIAMVTIIDVINNYNSVNEEEGD